MREASIKTALQSRAKEIQVALSGVDGKTSSGMPVTFDSVFYRSAGGRMVETVLSIRPFSPTARKTIKSVFDEIMASGNIDRSKTTKKRVFLAILVRNQRILKVEMDRPPGDKGWWAARFRSESLVSKSTPGSKSAPHNSPTTSTADVSQSHVVAGIRIPLSESTGLISAVSPHKRSRAAITTLTVPISLGKGITISAEGITYFSKGSSEKTKRAVVTKVSCEIVQRGQDYHYPTLKAFIENIRGRGQIIQSRKGFFLANMNMPVLGVKGEVSVIFQLTTPETRAALKRIGIEDKPVGRIGVLVEKPEKKVDTARPDPAKPVSGK